MAQVILNKISFGTGDTFTLQDARVDNLISTSEVLDRTDSTGGIEVRDDRLKLSYGGYYEDGIVVFEDNITRITNPNPGDYFSVNYTVQNYSDYLNNGQGIHFYMSYEWENSKGETGSETIELDTQFFTYEGIKHLSDGISDVFGNQQIYVITLEEDRDWEIIITFVPSIEEITINEINVYAPGIVPIPFPPEFVDFNQGFLYVEDGTIKLDVQMFSDLVQAVMNDDTITEDFEVDSGL